MKTFEQWLQEAWQAPVGFQVKPNLTPQSSYHEIVAEIKRCVTESLRYLATGADDRVEFNAYGFQVRIWRTRINTVVKNHIGYKSPWNGQYSEFRLGRNEIEKFADMLYQHRGSGGASPSAL